MLNQNENISNKESEDKYDKELYIVMELLKPPTTENLVISAKTEQYNFINQKQIKCSKINSEFGVYGVLVRLE